MIRRIGRAVIVAILVMGVYVGGTLVQVLVVAQRDGRRPAEAIVVLGAAQYNGRPSPVLTARLDHALDLWNRGIARTIVVTGGKQTGDRFTEATASANYLMARGVPDASILREVKGATSWGSLAAAARILLARGTTRVVLVSDPYHALRIIGIAEELGLDATASPTRTSPESSVFRHVLQETFGVSVARFIGYRRLLRFD